MSDVRKCSSALVPRTHKRANNENHNVVLGKQREFSSATSPQRQSKLAVWDLIFKKKHLEKSRVISFSFILSRRPSVEIGVLFDL